MSNYSNVLDRTAEEFDLKIKNNPLIELVASGGMTGQHYISYLRETYHMVRHTSRILSLAGASLEDEDRELRDWFFEQVTEENNHDLFCIRDLKNLGEDPDLILSVPPKQGSWGLVSQNYYMSTYGSAYGILVASLTEGLGADLGEMLSNVLIEKYGYKSSQVTFIKSHAGFDVKHIEDVKRAINDLVKSEGDLNEVIQGRRMTIHYYAQMFHDVLGL